MSILAWLAGSRMGRAIALALTTIAIIAFALLRAFSAGRTSAQAQANQDALKAVRQRIRIDEDIRSLGAGERRERLRRDWSDGR
jgi:hypothetical protein